MIKKIELHNLSNYIIMELLRSYLPVRFVGPLQGIYKLYYKK